LLAGHLVFFALFVVVSDVIFNLRAIFSTFPFLWLAAWALIGTISFLLLGGVVVSPGWLWRNKRRVIILGLAACSVGALAWIAGRASAELWTPMGQLTLISVKSLLSWFSAEIVYDPASAVVGINDFSVQITPVCSGYESIGLITVFLLAYFWWDRHVLRFPKVFLLLPIAIVLVWVANAIRITTLVMVGSWISEDIAIAGFHSQAGWIFFCSIALGLVSLARHLAFFSKNRPAAPGRDTWNPTAAYLMPLLIIIATALVTGLFIVDFNVFYPLQVIAGSIALITYRHYFTPRFSWSWQAAAIGIVVFVFWIALEPEPDTAAILAWQTSLYTLPAWLFGAWIVFRIFGSVIIIPVAEELAFRGYLLRRLVSADFTEVPSTRFALVPFIVSSLIFGMLHQNYLGGVLAGALYAIAQTRRGRLSDAILAHAITNGLISIYVIATGSWQLWM
jgi:exosortase E/protease (VPEID-CTERM system)